MMTARPAALNPAAMMSPAAIKMAGPVVIAHRTVGHPMAIPVAIAIGTHAKAVTGRPMAAPVVTGIVMTGHAKIAPVMIVTRVIVRKATARLMGIRATVTGTPAQRVADLSMAGPIVIANVEIVSAMIGNRIGAAMARHLKDAIPMKIGRKMAVHPVAARKRVAPGLVAVGIWTHAHKHPFALKPGLKIARSNVVLAIKRNPVDSAQAVNSHLSRAAKRLTVMAATRRCAVKGQHLLARNQALKLHMQMALPAA